MKQETEARLWILNEAERRILNDAEFKCRAVQAARVANVPEDGRAVAVAAIALVIAELPLGPGGSVLVP